MKPPPEPGFWLSEERAMSERTVEAAWMSLIAFACLLVPGQSRASGYDPHAVVPRGPIVVDMERTLAVPRVPAPQERPNLELLGQGPPTTAKKPPGKLPPGWVQLGEVVQREEIVKGLKQIDPEPSAAWEDIEGNQYPRKHTLYLNFNGGILYGGEDNSAEDKSALARAGEPYPKWKKAESTALAVVQRVKEDMAMLGVRVVYERRPNKTVPYTMAMVSGDWTDVNLDEPAGGVAPGTDCEARGQRHVVYVFDSQASTVGQEAAHAWGLDHTLGSDRIMSYQPGINKRFGNNCQTLCENACQGPGSIGCRLVHEKYCGVDSEQQNDLAELGYIFGGNEPDTEPPEVKITNPPNGTVLEVGSSAQIVGDVHDNYGGVGWKLTIVVDGELKFDEVDYDRALSWNLQKLPAGVYEVTLEAEDHADHIVRDTITFTVGTSAPSGTGSDSDSGETPTTSDTDDTAGTGSDASGEGSDTSSADDDGGCRISSGSRGPLGLLVPVLGLGLAWRARRRAPRRALRGSPGASTAKRCDLGRVRAA
jgi:hypothetical protein